MKWNSHIQDEANLVFTYSLLFLTIALLISGCGKESKNTSPQLIDTAVFTFSEAPQFDYGQQLLESITERFFTITNVGKRAATEMTGSFYLSLAFSFKGGTYPGAGGTCTDTLLPHDSCTVVVAFTPKFMGPTQTTLIINLNNGVQSTVANGPALLGTGN